MILSGLTGFDVPLPTMDGTGVVPFVATNSSSMLRAFKFDGSTWSDAVGSAAPTGASWQNPRLRLAPDGAPVVVWTDTSGTGMSVGTRLGVSRWTGSSWDSRVGSFNAGQTVELGPTPEMLVDSRGNIWLAWWEGTAMQVWMSNY
jgi:hypothetical protein